jgi:DNA recombination protein RmuC
MSNALITTLVLLIGLIVGLAIGIWFGRSQASQSQGSTNNDLIALKALLEKSEERLREAESKNESQAKIATQMEEMKTTVERMRVQAQDAAEKSCF